MKQLFYDLETTGVKHWRHGIHQIAGIVVVDGVEKERFDLRIQPYKKAEITEDALKIGGISREDLQSYMPMEKGKMQLTRILNKYVDRYNKKDKFHLTGYNNRAFDDKFLRAFFEYNNDNFFGSWFWADSIDVMVLTSYALRNEREKLTDFKLGTVAKYIGLEFNDEDAHDAFYDVQKTKEIYESLEVLL